MRNNKKKTILIASIAAGAVIIGVGAYFLTKVVKDKAGLSGAAGKDAELSYEEQLARHPYIREVNYTGPVKYMELFDYPFEKSDIYKMNKKFDPKTTHTDHVAQTAQAFIETLYTTDYREIVSDPESVKKKVIDYLDENAAFFSDAAPVISETDGLDYFLEDMSDYYVENALSTQAKFITDPELVYENAYLFCRGVIELESFGEGTEETLRCIPVEVMLKQDFERMSFDVVGIIPIEGYAEFAG